ncbi:hypothetical protein D0962_28960 [Leptolyngbyaceae cyanobacterium CCMR0082]|uniref:Uncharacterized protein n=2 Tax=Adonisia turfae TaxID=2950184 RepID=A0A6M0SGK4_9CYAN|nr:hypothetical protein [Adonisia turfae]NEZ57998.1 hypothetical protein [Adonisia turfae CCMR0081]NEZ66742.1 hypothetical protein [Adonisia turfae CCMR0082]
MHGQRIDHGLIVSLNVLLLFTVGFALVAYQVSPLRDPSFVPQVTNAGARVSWLNPERYWITTIRILAIALATNISLLTWSHWRGHRSGLSWINRNPLSVFLKAVGLCGVWLVVFSVSWYSALFFLLWQYILD